jgi:dipeptidyl aminopeptidase/acylaminoacyl peptidase
VRGDWNKHGVIVFGTFIAGSSGIARIPDSGGDPILVTATQPPIGFQLFPRFLPDGRRFLFHTVGADGGSGSVYLGSLDSKSATRLMTMSDFGPTGDNSQAEYAQGHLLFSRGRTLLAQPFDADHGTLSGEPAPLAENVGRSFSVSETGVLVYRTLPVQTGRPAAARLLWRDRTGRPISEMNTPADVGTLRLFQDGRIALDNGTIGSDRDVWVLDARGVPNKLTADNPTFDAFPVWSPDGSRIVFASSRGTAPTTTRLFQKPSNGAGAAEPLLPGDGQAIDLPSDWSMAGLIFQRVALGFQSAELWALSMSDKKASVYVRNGVFNSQAQFAPGSRYVAYTTNESGSSQIVVQTFPVPSDKWTITAQGGTEPLWSRDGRELYYLAPSGKLMAVSVKTEPTFQPGQTSELFATGLPPESAPLGRRYAVSDDGRRFLIASPANALVTDSTPITVVVNWPAALRKK